MAKVKKRGNSWQIDYNDPNGKRIRKAFKKKKDAEAELAKRVSLIAEGRYLDVKKDLKITLGELVEKYLENFTHPMKEHYCQNFKEYFGEKTLLSKIRYVDLETYRNHLKRKPTKFGGIRKDATVNREMSCLHHLFSKAFEWEMVEQSPFERGKSLMLKENNERVRFLNDDEIKRLLENSVPHLKDIIICAINTGMRRGEILNPKWNQIRGGFIYLQKGVKTKERREIPINDELDILFKRIKAQQHSKGATVIKWDENKVVRLEGNPIEHKNSASEYVFTYKGKRVKNIKKAFKTALKNAGITDFRFHDLRHTFASQVIMRGGDLKDVQELLGHKSMSMTLRYSHLSQKHKKRAVNLLNGLTASARNRHDVTNDANFSLQKGL
jgi:integrase